MPQNSRQQQWARSRWPGLAAVAAGAVWSLVLVLPTPARAMMGTALSGFDGANFRAADFSEGGGLGDPDYQAGQGEIDAGRFAAAALRFAKIVARGGDGVDAALYWQAYAESKAGKRAAALALLERLQSGHHQSDWLDDARALELELRGSRRATAAGDDDEELKLYALNALMNTDSERAVETLERFLRGNHSTRLLEQALFVLSQSDASRARQILAGIAQGTSDSARPELRTKALQMLGVAGDDESVRLLAEIYAGTKDVDTKSAVLDAFLVSGEADRVMAAARAESDAALRGKAIQVLGAMGAEEQLRELYRTEKSADGKRRILEGLFIAGDVETLGEVASHDPDPELRLKAIEGLGVSGGERTAALLSKLYQGGDSATKRAVINALFLQSDAKALLELARHEVDRELRREALQRLSLMDEPEALDFLLKQLED